MVDVHWQSIWWFSFRHHRLLLIWYLNHICQSHYSPDTVECWQETSGVIGSGSLNLTFIFKFRGTHKYISEVQYKYWTTIQADSRKFSLKKYLFTYNSLCRTDNLSEPASNRFCNPHPFFFVFCCKSAHIQLGPQLCIMWPNIVCSSVRLFENLS